MNVHLLYHYRDEDDEETWKLCGVYSSDESAQAAIQRFLPKPGFRDYPEQFLIAAHEIDRDEWSEGFGFDEEND